MTLSDRMLVIVPSRGRSDRLNQMIESFEATTSDTTDLLIVLDHDDYQTYSLPHGFVDAAGPRRYMIIPRDRMVPKVNKAFEMNRGYGWYAFMGDDHHPRTDGWDVALRTTGVAYGNDLLQGENLATAVVIAGPIVEALGFVAPPTLWHLFCDNYWMSLGRGLDDLTYRPDVVIEHVHYQNEKAERDATYNLGNNAEVWAHDEAAFRAWIEHEFPADLMRVREISDDTTVLITTDGRLDYLRQTIGSFYANVTGTFAQLLIHDDSGDDDVRATLRKRYPEWAVITTPGRSGFAGSRRHAWTHLRRHSPAPWVFMLEDDFTFNRPVDLGPMIDVMRRFPHLSQMALRRQGWSGPEIAAGGVVELRADEFTDHDDSGAEWLEHRLFWTSNPSVFRRSLVIGHDWPDGLYSEAEFCNRIFTEHPEWRSGYWGPRTEGPWVHHIGDDRHNESWGY